MAKKDFSSRLHDAVENYYHYNPDTLMPLMMVALAANGKLRIAAGTSIPENAACVLIPQEIIGYDWVELDAPLKRPSVIRATVDPSPMPAIAEVGFSISRMPGPPLGPS